MDIAFHLSLPCNDMEATKQFYIDDLGLKHGRSSSKWLDVDLFCHQITFVMSENFKMRSPNYVLEDNILPLFHFGVILEENFLKDAEGKWYSPDPENEADLEKLRTKRLLKLFDAYKTESAKPKAKKIKEVRVEALRAGFKQCYQDKDFQSIVSVGDKIPNNLLMEDEVLLQFYDIASNRV